MLKNNLRPLYNSTPKQWLRALKRHLFQSEKLSFFQVLRMRTMHRFKNTQVPFLGEVFQIVDSASFLYTYNELFVHEIYKFKPETSRPYILDCGANIGLSVLYFKKLLPQAEVVAFEPDPKIFRALKKNVESYRLEGVTLVPKAVWSSETTLTFSQEGADGGRIGEFQGKETIRTEATRLRDYLTRPIDLLKIDIEGAECEVIRDCKDLLGGVKLLFVEFHSFQNRPQELQSLLESLSEAGFRYLIQSIGIENAHPFVSQTVYGGMDMQLNIHAYRPK